MNTDLIMIPIGFVTMGVILLWFVIGSKGKWWLKAFTTVFVCHFCFLIWGSLNGLMGWAVEGVPDGRYEMLWVDIKEPSLTGGSDAEGIFVWVRNLEDEGGFKLFDVEGKKIEDNEPRAYKMPYSKKLRDEMNRMKQAIGQGVRVGLIVDDGAGKGKKGKGQSNLSQESDVRFYPMPPVKLPPKND